MEKRMKKTNFVLDNFGMIWSYVIGSWIGFFVFGMYERLLIANMLVAVIIALSKIIFLLNKRIK